RRTANGARKGHAKLIADFRTALRCWPTSTGHDRQLIPFISKQLVCPSAIAMKCRRRSTRFLPTEKRTRSVSASDSRDHECERRELNSHGLPDGILSPKVS